MAALVGIGAGVLAWPVAELSSRRTLLALCVLGAGVAGWVLTRRWRTTFLGLFLLSLNYVRWYPFGASQPQSLHWVSADLILGILLVLTAIEIVGSKEKRSVGSSRLMLAMVLFLGACLASMAYAPRADWVWIETGRWSRGLLILFVVRWTVDRQDWWAILICLSGAVVVQSLFGVYQVVGRRVVPLFGEDYFRANGTMLHPAYLAGYLLLLVPMIIALALTLPNGRWRQAAVLASGVGLLGILATLGRVPIVLVALQIMVLATTLVATGQLSPKVFLGITFAGLFVGLAIATPLLDQVVRRLSDSIDDAVDFRVKMNQTVLDMWSEHPVFGIGLNNFSDRYRHEHSDLEWAYRIADELAPQGIRFVVSVHNYILLICAETGLLGTMALVVLFGTIVWTGVRAISRTRGVERAVCLGILLGIVGVVLHDLTNLALSAEPVFITLFLLAGLLERTEHLSSSPLPVS
jgi:O-antigen ligase